jgi:hypothetical protein
MNTSLPGLQTPFALQMLQHASERKIPAAVVFIKIPTQTITTAKANIVRYSPASVNH